MAHQVTEPVQSHKAVTDVGVAVEMATDVFLGVVGVDDFEAR